MDKAISDKEIAIGGGRAGDKLKPLFEPAPQGMVLAERLTRYSFSSSIYFSALSSSV